jgi:hypothetical protein
MQAAISDMLCHSARQHCTASGLRFLELLHFTFYILDFAVNAQLDNPFVLTLEKHKPY